MPTFPCLGGNKKKREKNERNLTLRGRFCDLPETTLTEERTWTPTAFVAAAVVEESGVDRSLDRSRERTSTSRAFCVCVLNLSPYRRIKSIFFIYRKKKESSGEKKKGIEIPKPEKRKKNKKQLRP